MSVRPPISATDMAQALTSGAFSPACHSDSVPSSPQLWSLQQFPVATVLAAVLEVEAWVLVGTVAIPSPPAVGTAWVQVWEALVSPLVAAGAQWAVALASSSFPPHHPAGKITSTKAAILWSPLPLPQSLLALLTGCLGPSPISSSQRPPVLPGILASWLNPSPGLWQPPCSPQAAPGASLYQTHKTKAHSLPKFTVSGSASAPSASPVSFLQLSHGGLCWPPQHQAVLSFSGCL